MKSIGVENNQDNLFGEICGVIEQSRQKVALAINNETVLMYWHIGAKINHDVLNNNRAEYGKQIVATLSTQLRQ